MKYKLNLRTHLIYLLLICFFLAFALKLFAAPFGGSVEHGSATISQGNNITTVNQNSNSAIINWQSFNIGSNEAVRFNQPTASSITLNRVTGSTPSELYGSLSANGNIFLINEAGILVGNNASIDVSGLILSTANISNDDFLNGKYSFNNAKGSIQNFGNIKVQNGSYALFLGKSVENYGIIASKFSKIVLASGDSFKVDLIGNNLIGVLVNKDVLNANIINKGVIENESGTILLQAGSINNIMRSAINNEGLIDASSIEYVGGKVILAGGDIQNSGNILSNGTQGGSINLDAIRSINLSGSSLLSANGSLQNGGIIKAISKGSLSASKGVSINAESIYGNGGFVELSGRSIALSNNVSTRSKYGKLGTFFIDPTDVVIGNFPGSTSILGNQIDATWLSNQLNSSSLRVQADNSIKLNSDSSIISSGTGSLTLDAGTSVHLLGNLSLGGDLIVNSADFLSSTSNLIAAKNLNITADNVVLNNVDIKEKLSLLSTASASTPSYRIRSLNSALNIDLSKNSSAKINRLDIEAKNGLTVLGNGAVFENLRLHTSGDLSFEQLAGQNDFESTTKLEITANRINPQLANVPITLKSKAVLAHIYGEGTPVHILAEEVDLGGNTHAIIESKDTHITDLDFDGYSISGSNVTVEAPIYSGEEIVDYNNIIIDSKITANTLSIIAKNIHFERDKNNLKLINVNVSNLNLSAAESVTGNFNIKGDSIYIAAQNIGSKYKETVSGVEYTKSSAILISATYYAGLTGSYINLYTDNYINALQKFEFIDAGAGSFNAYLNNVKVDTSLYARAEAGRRVGLLPAETLNTNKASGDDLIRLVKSKTEPNIDKTPIIALGDAEYPKAKALLFKNKRIEVR